MAVPATLLTLGPGAGTGAVGSLINADDDVGIISITTGTIPSALSIVGTITYGEPYASAPNQILLTPANQFAAELGAGWVWIPDTLLTATDFKLKVPTVPLVTGITYKWYYQVIF